MSWTAGLGPHGQAWPASNRDALVQQQCSSIVFVRLHVTHTVQIGQRFSSTRALPKQSHSCQPLLHTHTHTHTHFKGRVRQQQAGLALTTTNPTPDQCRNVCPLPPPPTASGTRKTARAQRWWRCTMIHLAVVVARICTLCGLPTVERSTTLSAESSVRMTTHTYIDRH
jgi:hypothetical protein